MAIFLEIITFVVVLVVLIVVHELGHFFVAKLSGMRVDEFGIGYPPRALTMGKIGETEYTLNWLPFGGFVRIYGEDGVTEEVSEDGTVVPSVPVAPDPRAFSARPHLLQALTLIAGIAMNVVLAFVLFTITQALGVQQELDATQIPQAHNVQVVVSDVQKNSPAAAAGFKPGDIITSETYATPAGTQSNSAAVSQKYTDLIKADTTATPITFGVLRAGKPITVQATPHTQVLSSAPAQPALGFVVATIGTLKVSLLQAPVNGALITWNAIQQTAAGLFDFFKNIVLFKADLSQVSGPVGIVGEVGVASAQGFTTLLSFMAIISINLALINLIPIPALDGGRLLFVIIEAITRRPLNPKIGERVNAVGFGLLLLLMAIVTVHDVYKLFF